MSEGEYDPTAELIENELAEDLSQITIPQLSAIDIVTDEPSSASPGDTYLTGSSTTPSTSYNSVDFTGSDFEEITVDADRPWDNWSLFDGFAVEFMYSATDDSHDHLIFRTNSEPGQTERIQIKLLQSGNVEFFLRDTAGDRKKIIASTNINLFDGDGHRYRAVNTGEDLATIDCLELYVDGQAMTVESSTNDGPLGDLNSGQIFLGQGTKPYGGTQTVLNQPSQQSSYEELISIPHIAEHDTMDGDFTVELIFKGIWEPSKALFLRKGPGIGNDFTCWSLGQNAELSTTDGDYSLSLPKLEFNAPTHIALIREGNTAYTTIGGEIYDSISVSGTTTTDSNGIYSRGDNYATYVDVNFWVDNMALWNVSRLSEIQDNPYRDYDGSESGLVGLYKCNDDTTASTLVDSTANGNDGTLSSDKEYLTLTLPQYDSAIRPDGRLRDWRVWDRALDPTENFSGVISGLEDGLSGYWPLTFSQNNISFDYSLTDSDADSYNVANPADLGATSITGGGIELEYQNSVSRDYSWEDEDDLSLPFVTRELFGRTSAQAQDGSYSYGVDSARSQSIDGPLAYLASTDQLQAVGGLKPDYIEMYYYEDSSSDGGGFRLLNSNGNYELGFASDSPDMVLDDAAGFTTIATPSSNTWQRVYLNFDWSNNNYYYELAGNSGTRDLKNGVNIIDLQLWNYNSQTWGSSAGNIYIYWDNLTIDAQQSTFSGDNLIARYMGGGDWIFWGPEDFGNPRCYVKNQDAIYIYRNGGWSELQTGGTGTSIDRIESGSLPSSPSDGDYLIDARYSVEWFRVYDSGTGRWELIGSGHDVVDIDDLQFHWQDGNLDPGLKTTDTGELELVV